MRALGWVRVVGKRMLALRWLVRAHSTRGRWFVRTQTMEEKRMLALRWFVGAHSTRGRWFAGDTNHGGDRFGVVGTQIMWERAIGCILIVVCGDTNHGEASAAADSFSFSSSFSFCMRFGPGMVRSYPRPTKEGGVA